MAAHASDVELARALAQGSPEAFETFERELLPAVDVVVRRIDASTEFLDEVKQQLRTRLFVEPKSITDFSGQGPLVAWLRTAAARLALNHLRPEKRELRDGTDELDALPFAAPGPELALLKGRHEQAFRTAFARAVQDLSVRERTALKLNALDGVPLERIAAIYGCDKSTVSRWVTKAHQLLLEGTRTALAAELKLPPTEVESLIRALQSQLAPSLARLLEPASP
jgi:RNA polymerase sigma-70 factor (ECF subfamily)